MKPSSWIAKDNNGEYSPWEHGFVPTDLIDGNASGSSRLGQIADLINTDVSGNWPVSSAGTSFVAPSIQHAKIGAGWEAVIVIFDDDSVLVEAEQIATTAEKIESIRDVFGISVSQLAKILRTSRPSIYSWVDGEEPREKTTRRVEKIYEFAQLWSSITPYHFAPGQVMRQKLGESFSMLEQLEQEDLDTSVIEQGLFSILELMHRKYERMCRSSQRTGNVQISDSSKLSNRHALTTTIGSSD